MAKKIGIITIHGMGEQKPNFDDGLKKALRRKFRNGVNVDIAFKGIYYQGFIQPSQTRVWNDMGFKNHPWMKCVLLLILPVAMLLSRVLGRPELNPLRGCWVSMRKLFLFGFSDATSYQLKPELDKSIYNRVSQELLDCINALPSELESQNSPVVIIAHSLGCHVISNYIWDAQKGTGFWKDVEPGTTPFQKLDTTSYMFTAGCNIPLFVAGYEKIAAVRKPNPGFQWINYYDRDDVLGYPLRPLSTGFDNSYDAVVTSDEPINVGNILEFWNPASPTGYWEHSNFIKPVADRINALHAKL